MIEGTEGAVYVENGGYSIAIVLQLRKVPYQLGAKAAADPAICAISLRAVMDQVSKKHS